MSSYVELKMPRPLSSAYELGELNAGSMQREAILERLTPQALLQKAKSSLTDNWRNALPTDMMGQPLEYDPAAGNVLNTLRSGQINAADDTGSISVGPQGIYLSNRNNTSENLQKESDIWNLEINPLTRAGSFSKGDFGIGGTFGQDKSGFIRKGPVRIDAGYGQTPVYSPSPAVAPYGSYQTRATGNEPWAKLSLELGDTNRMMQPVPDMAAKFAVENAIQRDLPKQVQEEPAGESVKEYANAFLKDYMDKNEDWWRP